MRICHKVRKKIFVGRRDRLYPVEVQPTVRGLADAVVAHGETGRELGTSRDNRRAGLLREVANVDLVGSLGDEIEPDLLAHHDIVVHGALDTGIQGHLDGSSRVRRIVQCDDAGRSLGAGEAFIHEEGGFAIHLDDVPRDVDGRDGLGATS